MTKKKIAGIGLGIVGVFSACLLAPQYALASEGYIVGGHSGFGYPNSAKGCFQGAFAEMRNYCTDAAKLLVIPLGLTATGISYTFAATVRGNAGESTSCRPFLMNTNNGEAWASALQSRSANTFGILTWGPQFIPAGHTTHFECTVARQHPVTLLQGGVLKVFAD